MLKYVSNMLRIILFIENESKNYYDHLVQRDYIFRSPKFKKIDPPIKTQRMYSIELNTCLLVEML